MEKHEVKEVVEETIEEVLEKFGLNPAEIQEAQRDFIYLVLKEYCMKRYLLGYGLLYGD